MIIEIKLRAKHLIEFLLTQIEQNEQYDRTWRVDTGRGLLAKHLLQPDKAREYLSRARAAALAIDATGTLQRIDATLAELR